MRARTISLLGAAMAAILAAPCEAAPRWSAADLAALHGVVSDAVAEGLTQFDPAPMSELKPGDLSDVLADVVALKLAKDYYEGSEQVRADRSWHIDRTAMDYRVWLDQALSQHDLRADFHELLPDDARYAALRRSLATCGKPAACATIAANLDRLRALPRNMGTHYLWVNVPAYRLDLIETGRAVASHRIIVGKLGSQTPTFQSKVTGVTINPWWNVPCSIVDESIGKLVATNPREAARRGYVVSRDTKGKLVVRQRPGPDNALGQIKLEMPNPYNVYIHDTPSKALFANGKRAFSHGCIRTEDPHSLAVSLLGPDMEATVNMLLATRVTRTLKLPQQLPVFVVYMTAEPGNDGEGAPILYPDIYNRDPR